MFKATKEFTLGEQTIQVGQEVANPTARMIDLGLVVEVTEVVETKTDKPKKEKKTEVKEEVKEVKEEILTEDSATITVEKTEE